jgi:hypothetical protein
VLGDHPHEFLAGEGLQVAKDRTEVVLFAESDKVHVVRHDDELMQLQPFVALAMSKALQQECGVVPAREDIHPPDHSEGDEVCMSFLELPAFAHEWKIRRPG